METDYIRQLKDQGYAVIPGVLQPEEADAYVERVWEWLRRLSKRIDRNDPATWTREYGWPHTLRAAGVIHYHNVGHEQFVWDLRSDPRICDVYANVWNTDELIVSYDGMYIHTPQMERSAVDWEHTNQKPDDVGPSYQGLINLIDSDEEDSCFVVRPKSHLLYDEFLEGPGKDLKHFYGLAQEYKQWYDDRSCLPVRVAAPKGSFVIWDSRCIHANSTSQLDIDRKFRMCVYVAMVPRSFADNSALKKREEFFENGIMSGHRPHVPKEFETLATYGDNGEDNNPNWIGPTLNALGKSLI